MWRRLKLQCYTVPGDKLENVHQSFKARREYSSRLAAEGWGAAAEAALDARAGLHFFHSVSNEGDGNRTRAWVRPHPVEAQRSHMKEATCNVRVAVLPPGFEAGALSI